MWSSNRKRVASAALVALLAARLTGCDGGGSVDRGPAESELRGRLIAAVGPIRVGDGRLVGIDWAPVGWAGLLPAPPDRTVPTDGSLRRAPASAGPAPTLEKAGDPRLRSVLSELRRALAHERSPEALGTLSLWYLAGGRLSDAIDALEEARAAAPADAALATDLAAAYLARSLEPGHEGDAFTAVEAAAAAVALAPERADARFNLAVSLERLGATRQARRAWRSYLALDPTSSWGAEAARRSDLLQQPASAERWRQGLPDLTAAAVGGDSVAVAALVEPHRAEARERVERELLSRWAAEYAVGRTREAAAALTEARAIAAALAAVGGDPLPAAAVEAIDQALDGAPRRLEALVRGHLAFAAGLEAHGRYSAAEAAAAFTGAEESLASGGSPLAGWAGLYRAIQDYQLNRYEAALEHLDRVEEQAAAVSSPSLAGRAGWIRALTLGSTGRFWAALSSLRRASDRYAAAGESGNRAFVDGMIAATFDAVGKVDECRRHFALALARLDLFPSVRSEQAILDSAAEALAAGGAVRAALLLQEEVADRLGREAQPTDLAFVHLRRSRLHRRLDAPEEARVELAAAERWNAAIDEPAVHEVVATEIAVSRAELLGTTDPEAAEAALGVAIASLSARGRPFPLTQLHFSRARLRLAAGDVAGSESDLRAAIATLENQRREIGEALLRQAAFARSEEIFDALVGRLAEQPGRGAEAWAEAERGRARVLLDLALRSPPGVAAADATAARRAMSATALAAAPARPASAGDELLRRLPPGIAVIEYAVLGDRTVSWVVRRGEVATEVVPVGEAELRRRVEAVISAVAGSRDGRTVDAAAGELAKAVLTPLVSHLRSGEPVVVIPDGPLIDVPFALLPDPFDGRRLIETRTISVSPSTALFVLASERSRSPTATPRVGRGEAGASILVVGDPAFDRQVFPSLERLPGAAREARSVGALHPRARLLLGGDATAAALLEQAPGAAIVHLAAHAVPARAEPLSSALVLAGGGGRDGTVAAREILALDLRRTRLVVLSACRAAAGAGGEQTWTLAHAFLAAGVSTVIANLWDVEDGAAERLAVAFHRHLAAGATPAAALRAAQLELMASPDPRDRHPAVWAGFRVIGGSG